MHVVFLEVSFWGLLRSRARHDKIEFLHVLLILDLEYESIGRIGLLAPRSIRYQSYVSIPFDPPNWDRSPQCPKMLRNRNRVLPRDEIRQAASQAKQLSEIQFQGFSLVAWSGTFHIKSYCSARTKLVCILMEAVINCINLHSFVFDVSREGFGELASVSI